MANGTPGCGNTVCCLTVCGQLPFCCANLWDETCGLVAEELCNDVLCDCNFNGVPDDEDIAGGTSADKNGNGIPDECDPQPDCNSNGVPDLCDVDPEDPDGDGIVSADDDGNGVPDECQDCNNNGVLDELDIDPADPDGDGSISSDCNGDGVPDECCDVDMVFVLDTSGSMLGELPDVCADMITPSLDALAALIQGQIRSTVLVITGEPVVCASSSVTLQLGTGVPGEPGSCGPTACTVVGWLENWAPATTIVAERFNWDPDAVRVVVPLSDEGPCEGNNCADPGADRDAIDNAVNVAVDRGATIFPVTGGGASHCVRDLADDLGAGTGGRAWHRQLGLTWAEIGAGLAFEIALRSQVLCSVCDADGDGTPNACECPWDIDCDNTVGIADFLGLLAAWGVDPGGPPDFDYDGDVGIADFLALLAAWGPCP